MGLFWTIKVSDIVKFYLLTVILGCLLNYTQAIIHWFLQALFNHYFNTYAVRFVEPIATFLLGGPTVNAISAIYRVTPILNPSILGSRIDNMIQIAASSLIQALVYAISNIIENILRVSTEVAIAVATGALAFVTFLFETNLKILELLVGRSLSGKENAGDLLPKLIDVTEASPTGTTLATEATRVKRSSSTEARPWESIGFPGSQKDNILFGSNSDVNNPNDGRFYPGGERALGARYDVTGQLLERNPLLERFLKAVEEDSEEDCLKELLCSIHASTDGNLTKEELKLKLDFRELVKKYNVFFPSLSPLVKASNTGEKGASQKTCQEAYPNCTYPVLNRALFLFLTRFKAMREH